MDQENNRGCAPVIERLRARRRTIIVLVVLLILGCVSWHSVYIAPHQVNITHVDITIPSAGGPLSGLKIIHVSDTHITSEMNSLKKVVEDLNSEQADLICVTGDIVQDDDGIGVAVETYSRLQSRYGTFAVLGNSDYGVDTESLVAALHGVGVHVLRNECVKLNIEGHAVAICGLDDPVTGHHDIKKLNDHMPPEGVRILLAHSPIVATCPDCPKSDLLLAGHTHGGAIRLPLIGALYSRQGVPRRLSAGLVREKGHLVYVSRGLDDGYTPVRFMNPPEAAVLQIKVE